VFGIPVSLNLGRDSKFRSTFGFFMSIIFILLLAAYVIYQLLGILGISSKTFSHVTSVEQIVPTDHFYAGNGRFKIGIGLQDKETAERIKDAKVFGVRAKYDYRQNNPTTGRTESISFNLKVEPCKSDYFEGYLKDNNDNPNNKSSTTDFDKLICLSEDQATLPEDKQNLKIIGQFDSSSQGKIVFSLERCKIDCKPAAEIDRMLSRSNVAIYFINNGPDFNNLDSPYRRLIQTYYTSTDPKFTKLLDIAIKKARVQSDTGVILPGNDTKTYTALDRFSESISSENDQVIFRTQVQISTNMDVTIRSYKKLYTVFAEIGGYIKAFVIFAFLYRPFLKRLYYMEIINNLYRLERNRNLADVEIEREREERVKNLDKDESILFRSQDPDMKEIIEEKKREEAEARKSKMHEIENPALEGLHKSLHGDELNRESEPGQQEDDEENPQTYVLKYTWMDWIAIVCPCLKTKKHKLLDRGRKIVENNTDITVIIRKLQEFELLKKMILSKDQEVIFNKLPKPNLLEIVESEEQEEAMKPIEEQLGAKSTESARGIDGDEGNVLNKIERQERDRLSKKADEHKVVQDIYNKLKRERGQSTINDNLLTALEEYVVKNRESLAAEEDFKRKSVKRQPPPEETQGNTFSRDDPNDML